MGKHYNMYTYITKELPELVSGLFPVDGERRSITGHSMGGHGALICHLKNPGMFSSVSAFSPICNPTVVPWGEKAFTGYLGSVEAGKAYDATELVSNYDGPKVPLLIDQGTADGFLDNQLKPKNFFMAAAKNNYKLVSKSNSQSRRINGSNKSKMERRNSICGLCLEMSNKSCVQVERSSIFEVTDSIGSSTNTNNRSRKRNCSLCTKVSSTGRSNSLLIFRNLSSIRIINKSDVQVERSSIFEFTGSIGNSINTNNRSRNRNCNLCTKVSSTGRSNSLVIFRNLSSIRIINKSGVQVKRSSILKFTSSKGSCNTNNRRRDRDCSLCAKMSSTGRSNSVFIFRNLSSIGIINKLSVQVDRSSIFEFTGSIGSSTNTNRNRHRN